MFDVEKRAFFSDHKSQAIAMFAASSFILFMSSVFKSALEELLGIRRVPH